MVGTPFFHAGGQWIGSSNQLASPSVPAVFPETLAAPSLHWGHVSQSLRLAYGAKPSSDLSNDSLCWTCRHTPKREIAIYWTDQAQGSSIGQQIFWRPTEEPSNRRVVKLDTEYCPSKCKLTMKPQWRHVLQAA